MLRYFVSLALKLERC